MRAQSRALVSGVVLLTAVLPLAGEEPAEEDGAAIPAISIDSRGNVGVGTEAPLGVFNVTTAEHGGNPSIDDGQSSFCDPLTDWYDEDGNGKMNDGECKVTGLLVTATGRVGIGTAYPTASLASVGDFSFGWYEEGRGGMIWSDVSTGTLYLYDRDSYFDDPSPVSLRLRSDPGGGNPNRPQHEVVIAMQGGRLGLGTETPGGFLGIKDANTFLDVDGDGNLVFQDKVSGSQPLWRLAADLGPWTADDDRVTTDFRIVEIGQRATTTHGFPDDDVIEVPPARLVVNGDVDVRDRIRVGDMALWQAKTAPAQHCGQACGEGFCLGAYLGTAKHSCTLPAPTQPPNQQVTCLCAGLPP